MKKIIIILFLTSIFAEHNNPNGKPFTLNIKFDVQRSSFPWQHYDFRTNANMPISPYFTIYGGFYEDRYEKTYDQVSTSTEDVDVYYGGLELHLPLYEIWKN